jgi:hypothetical protein
MPTTGRRPITESCAWSCGAGLRAENTRGLSPRPAAAAGTEEGQRGQPRGAGRGHRPPNPAAQGPSWTPRTTPSPTQLLTGPRGRTAASIAASGPSDRAAGLTSGGTGALVAGGWWLVAGGWWGGLIFRLLGGHWRPLAIGGHLPFGIPGMPGGWWLWLMADGRLRCICMHYMHWAYTACHTRC